jgi:uroporphyrin-III C-methyltransferase
MPGRRFRALAEELIAAGIAASTPCVAVSQATMAEELVTTTTLGEIEDVNIGPAPVLLLIGEAVRIGG